ncbi:hypothetical protein LJB71_13760 [Thermomonas sp. S9]|nr:hypothetical protein [Thermomonas sp. S9]
MRGPRHGLARVLSKRGLCSRSAAERLVRAGRVRLEGRVVRDPEHPVDAVAARIAIDGAEPVAALPRYLMLNKPRGLVTTARDERGRDTVYRCFDGAGLGWIAPVGRLDKASEGLLLFSNDPQWAARITDPATGPVKTYHVQVDRIPDDATLAALRAGVEADGERLRALSAVLLRAGGEARVARDRARRGPQPPDPAPAGGVRHRRAAAGAGGDRAAGPRHAAEGAVAGVDRGGNHRARRRLSLRLSARPVRGRCG